MVITGQIIRAFTFQIVYDNHRAGQTSPYTAMRKTSIATHRGYDKQIV